MIDKENLVKFQEKTDELDVMKTELREKRAQFENENICLIDRIVMREKDMGMMRERISAQAEAEFRASGTKKLVGGLGIRVMTALIYEADRALGWAKSHNLCLGLDKRAFERMAKAEELPFVKKEEKVVVTFPKKIEVVEG